MTYIALYRKYRPKKFADVAGQETAITILRNSIKNNKIGHAYIFSGTRGTGKTSTAKIFSHAVNCLSPVDGDLCNECSVCKNMQDNNIDIIEIDAASNNGIDEIREIRDSVTLIPNSLKYKVYIIDEVHMLSGSAFNALLKTLEEPPEHVIFILATTELNKVPLTVLSRCQKIDFKKIPPKILEKRLKYIIEQEKYRLDDAVIKLISQISDGSFRDAINYIDQLTAFNKKSISIDDVYDLIGDISDDDIYSFTTYIIKYDVESGLKFIDYLYNSGKNFYTIGNRLLNFIRDIIIYDNTHNYFFKEYEEKLEKFSNINIETMLKLSELSFELTNILKKSNNQKTLFETYFIKMILLFESKQKFATKGADKKEKKEEKEEKKIEYNDDIEKSNPDNEKLDNEEKQIMINNTLAGADKELKQRFILNYNLLDDYISIKEFNSVATLLKKGTPEVVSSGEIIFSFIKSFEVVLFNKNFESIQKLLKKIYTKKYNVIAVTKEEWKNIKNKYIDDIKNGIKYEKKSSIIKNNKKNKTTALEKEAENIFGDEIVTFE